MRECGIVNSARRIQPPHPPRRLHCHHHLLQRLSCRRSTALPAPAFILATKVLLMQQEVAAAVLMAATGVVAVAPAVLILARAQCGTKTVGMMLMMMIMMAAMIAM
jgi:hypothetical protein